MAAAVEEVLGPRLAEEKQLTGWINVPADCVRPLKWIRLHAARPAGVNEPTAAGAAGATEILRLVESLAAGRLVPLPALRRRLGPAAGAGGSDYAGRQARRHSAPQRGRREHRTAQYGPQATQPDQRRRTRPGLPRGTTGFAHHLRRARRSVGPDRLRPDGRRPLDAGGRAGRARAVFRRAKPGIPAAVFEWLQRPQPSATSDRPRAK